jgi:hypothetical protein
LEDVQVILKLRAPHPAIRWISHLGTPPFHFT